ncbi:hypothetical protein Psch_02186 [Pelotomaculum schinkii]|uniref:Uncharacterized protein n=1 Tax=Pelotomaculum schinkii TaxID=78350 RepID=A0A4Y7RIQ3_9FIRM|nr:MULTISPECIES: hypothetical protein [Pelotomaculum]TEB08620.1 hypothetical protein Psch_02186 [Pelotomaculum schinkii]TEB16815.1 hypothetical protein Psfp_00977 [Pelotomaculum sp. FP]
MGGQTAAFTGTEIKKKMANHLVRLRRLIRFTLSKQNSISALRRSMKDDLAAEKAKVFKNQYLIAELEEIIEDLDSLCSDYENQLVTSGEFLLDILPIYEASGASDHDFAQLINCNIKRMERIRRDFDEQEDNQGRSFFVDAIFIYHAEQPIEREKEDFVISWDLPFFHAMTHHFIRELETNSKLRQAAHDKIDELFPELQANQYIATITYLPSAPGVLFRWFFCPALAI